MTTIVLFSIMTLGGYGKTLIRSVILILRHCGVALNLQETVIPKSERET
jgi:hypothetical protein